MQTLWNLNISLREGGSSKEGQEEASTDPVLNYYHFLDSVSQS